MSELFKEEDFYKDNGWPSEELRYCQYHFNINDDDYDQFILVENSFYPYIRLSRKRGNSQYPCGLSTVVAVGGSFSLLSDAEREERCPKIAWGFAAVFLANLGYDSVQKDYVLLKDIRELIRGYYDKYLKIYLQCHNGLRYKSLSLEQKELNFLSEHEALVKSLWVKTEPLKAYADLYEYASDAEADYEDFLQKRKDVIVNMGEEKTAPLNTKEMGERRIINQNGNGSVYIENSTGPIIIGGNRETTGNVASKNEAFFNDIANQIIKDLDGARVSIHVAIAWFTNQRIADKLVEKYKDGLDVKVVFFKDHTNSKFGVNIDNIPFKAIRGTRGGMMHNKFCVIDNQKVITGSYNWSENAENKNDENAAVMYDNDCASSYSVEFRRLFAST